MAYANRWMKDLGLVRGFDAGSIQCLKNQFFYQQGWTDGFEGKSPQSPPEDKDLITKQLNLYLITGRSQDVARVSRDYGC
jgi:hypothetical protein